MYGINGYEEMYANLAEPENWEESAKLAKEEEEKQEKAERDYLKYLDNLPALTEEEKERAEYWELKREKWISSSAHDYEKEEEENDDE